MIDREGSLVLREARSDEPAGWVLEDSAADAWVCFARRENAHETFRQLTGRYPRPTTNDRRN